MLLGAGASQPAGYFSTEKLTEKIVQSLALDVTPEEEELGQTAWADSAEIAQVVIDLIYRIAIRVLNVEEEEYSSPLIRNPFRPLPDWASDSRIPINYEDIYALANQAHVYTTGELDNQAIHYFVSELRQQIFESGYFGIDFGSACDTACRHIAATVRQALSHRASRTDHLTPFLKACQAGRVNCIATLSHDTHVESFLKNRGVLIADGFSSKTNPTNYGRRWEENFGVLDSTNSQEIPFLKLHGSVDWEFQDNVLYSVPSDRIGASESKLGMLIGTFNKIMDYSQGPFLAIHYRFRKMLKRCDRLMVCGYSFKDTGINSTIIEWYDQEPGRRILVIEPRPEQLMFDARGEIKERWNYQYKDWAASILTEILTGKAEDQFIKPDHATPMMQATSVMKKGLESVDTTELVSFIRSDSNQEK